MGPHLYRHIGLLPVLLLPVLVTALECDSLEHKQQIFNSQFLQLLKEKGGTAFPQECLPKMTAFNFPAKSLGIRQPHFVKRAIYEILKGFFGIISSNVVQTVWTTTTRERLLSALHAQSERIKRCFGDEKTGPGSAEERLRLLRYFKRIRTFLQGNSRGACAKPILQLEVWTSLNYLDMLTKRMNI